MFNLHGIILLLFFCSFFSACSNNGSKITTDLRKKKQTESIPAKESAHYTQEKNDYRLLRNNITLGRATLTEIRQALTDKDIGRLTNTIHALYSMRWHPGVIHILKDMWKLDNTRFPELSWEIIEKTPTKLAIASTLNRIQGYDTDEYLNYLREHKYDNHEFHLSQVIIALALNGDPEDIEYMVEMTERESRYIKQSAITGLGLMGNEKSKLALGRLWKKHKGTALGTLIETVLRDAYQVTPFEKPVTETTATEN